MNSDIHSIPVNAGETLQQTKQTRILDANEILTQNLEIKPFELK